ncbi:MAG: tRNA (adenosine(37)-N6)-threonylcarbamoyltransferase complex ATPase subunit type 1 TsaE [Puniceicoccales bacterium]|jgi:tRNA threonylcarbamoyladenosine biosynthesis protein TsaE|nr:tRNA (adenosine(37)-N6)-threonylcarbamoyltransferase complex ATPase subunit type 1 TsaE [Puniceicoccales bacterium]
MEQLVEREIICKTANETKNLAREVAKFLPANSSIALIGGLGAGKTTFVRGLAEGFGMDANVSSPSFNILNIYSGVVTLLHLDAYRLDGSPQATDGLMLEDFLIPPYCLVAEWPELLHGFLDRCGLKIFFTVGSDFSRRIIIRPAKCWN